MSLPRKPRILLLADKRNWAYDYAAHAIEAQLRDTFDFKILYVGENPETEAALFDADIIHVFWWGENWHHRLGLPPSRIVKELSSFRWREEAQFGFLSPKAFVEIYLKDAATLVTTSRKMQSIINPLRETLYTPNGIDPQNFFMEKARTGPIRIGWAGNINDACKGIRDIIMPACEGDYELMIAPGNITSRDSMRAFYNQVDIFCVASTAEGQPLPLIESLACGCFPVTVDVGVVPEVIRHRDNGLIVERSVAAFRAALSWCNSNLPLLRQNAALRAAEIQEIRSWKKVAPLWHAAYSQALAAKGAA